MSSPREEANLAAVALVRQSVRVRDGHPMDTAPVLDGYLERFREASGSLDDQEAIGTLIGALASLAAAGVMGAACAAGSKPPDDVTTAEIEVALDGLERGFLELQ